MLGGTTINSRKHL